jgi:uncharacterized membrane protein YeiB
MSTVFPQPTPEVLWYDWALIYAGLAFGIGLVFQVIETSVVDTKRHSKNLYTLTNFWLIFSGVIHVIFLFREKLHFYYYCIFSVGLNIISSSTEQPRL